jgi:hypothetical protein
MNKISRGRPKGSTNVAPRRDSKERFNQEVEDARRFNEIHGKDFRAVRKARTTYYSEEAEYTTDDLSQLMRDYAGQNASVQSLLKYYQDAKALGAYGVVEECLVVARYTLGQEAKKKISERNDRLIMSSLQIVANLAKTLKDLEDNDAKIAQILQLRTEQLYDKVASALVAAISDPVTLHRVFEQVTGQKVLPRAIIEDDAIDVNYYADSGTDDLRGGTDDSLDSVPEQEGSA